MANTAAAIIHTFARYMGGGRYCACVAVNDGGCTPGSSATVNDGGCTPGSSATVNDGGCTPGSSVTVNDGGCTPGSSGAARAVPATAQQANKAIKLAFIVNTPFMWFLTNALIEAARLRRPRR